MNNLKSFHLFLESIDEISQELLDYLLNEFETGELDLPGFEAKKWILVDDKMRFLKGNKKYLVNKIFQIIHEDWKHLKVDIIRRTIKKYFDHISDNS